MRRELPPVITQGPAHLISKESRLTIGAEPVRGIATRYFLIKCSAMFRGRFKTDAVIPESGIYRVMHAAHRLPHEVTLLKGEKFPKCQKCSHAVTFKLLRALNYSAAVKDSSWRITLYELPVVENDLPSIKTG